MPRKKTIAEIRMERRRAFVARTRKPPAGLPRVPVTATNTPAAAATRPAPKARTSLPKPPARVAVTAAVPGRPAQWPPLSVVPKSNLAIGVIACPRKDVKLGVVLGNMRWGGFTEDIHVFAEPGTPRQEMAAVVWHQNANKLGGYRNWIRCMTWLLAHTKAPHLLICEDDADYVKEARQYVDGKIAVGGFDVLSLYLARRYGNFAQKQPPGWVLHGVSGRNNGTVAMLFTREALAAFVADSVTQACLKAKRQIHYDQELFNWVIRSGRQARCLAHRPSLVNHIGPKSNLGHRDNGSRAGLEFARERS